MTAANSSSFDPLKRRLLIVGLGGIAASWTLAARAQNRVLPVVGFLNNGSPEAFALRVTAFRQGLADTGYIDGQNVAIEFRWANGDNGQIPALAADLVARSAAVIAATGGVAAALGAKSAATATPIVFAIGADPIKFGLVSSLNRPGGNVTGVSFLANTILAKQVQILHEAVSKATSIGFLVNPTNPNAEEDTKTVESAAHALGRELFVVKASTDDQIDAAIASLVRQGAGALVIFPDALFTSQLDRLLGLTSRHRLPAIYNSPDFAARGGLMGYGTDQAEAYRQAGLYVGRILKGEKPADLPVQQSTKVELVINLTTAKALGLALSPTLLARADRVIE